MANVGMDRDASEQLNTPIVGTAQKAELLGMSGFLSFREFLKRWPKTAQRWKSCATSLRGKRSYRSRLKAY